MFKDANFLSAIAPKPEPIGLVYFISTKERAFPIKIGRTTNYLASSRMNQLQVGCPYRLEFFAAIAAPVEYEQELHDRFAGLSLRGEWFARDRQLMVHIDLIQRDNPGWRNLVKAPRPGELVAATP